MWHACVFTSSGLSDRAMKNWLQAIWVQVFRKERLIAPERYLDGNFTVGLFAVIVILAGSSHPERTNLLFYLMVGGTAATHLGGFLVAKAVRRLLDTTVVVQASFLFATTVSLVLMNMWLTIHADRVSDVRYVPGLVLSLLTYASLQLEFVGPPSLRRLRVKRLGILLGAASETSMAALFLWRLACR
jgi:hypothetical protein